VPAATDAAAASSGRAAADLCGEAADRLGSPSVDRPGDLLHAAWTLYARFQRPGHAVTGDRSSTAAEKRARVGYDYAHAIVDDHSRLAYAELLPDAKAATVTAFTERAITFFAAHGIAARRLMTDNHWSYVLNRSLRELLAHHRISHLTTPKRRPQPNGKVERFHQTMATRMGLRRPLPPLTTPRRRTATLARLLRMKVKWLDARRLLCESCLGAGDPRAKAQDVGLCPAALLGRLTAHELRAPVRRPRLS
jgi:transposase InsO family protein